MLHPRFPTPHSLLTDTAVLHFSSGAPLSLGQGAEVQRPTYPFSECHCLWKVYACLVLPMLFDWNKSTNE